jgi:membrane associated rhomboid family serine protease
MPWAVGLLIAITVVLSLTTAVNERHGGLGFDWLSLQPGLVLRGQAWRLLTWPFLEPSLWSLFFTCLSLYWFGSPLAQLWRSPRFLFVFAAAMTAAGVGTCLIALIDPAVRGANYIGSYAIITGGMVAWGLTFPNNVVRIYFVLPIRGFWMAWLTVALTVGYACYSGWTNLLPEMFTEAVALGWFYRRLLVQRWSTLGRDLEDRRRQAARSREARRRGGIVVDLHTGEVRPPDDELN